ncbi:putative Peptidylprolyl isomerase [Hyella patelloides LEGE 07179]|uniref:peptidylprolyl isomerase n=1 Tax=Hyella patelloides LEGE 07179 TaxID=945734 RepID=A0A563VMW4_9CYAN|nr:peptidylprolyl isomerase [Hyella patelloides]VEP12625.1 putative Peptidylprolyl isomerase [Hyella patelloides LEGE 07179]
MLTTKNNKLLHQKIKLVLLTLMVVGSITFGSSHSAIAVLAQGDAITDPKAILRYALPIENQAVRKMQGSLEDLSRQLRVKMWGKINKDIKDASFQLNVRRNQILAGVPEDSQPHAEELLNDLKAGVEEMKEFTKNRDREALYIKRRELLDLVTELEESMVAGFPYEVPKEYANLPQLLGRATVEMKTNKGDLTVVVDGYSAPVNGGNFVDLVHQGFYDGLEFNRAEDFYIVQAGDPPGEEDGFIDPETQEYRAIPLEVLTPEDEIPVYEATLEEMGRYLDTPTLPFNAYGAIALARPADDPNGGSSQFFFFKFDTELTPPGYNLMDGRYSVFGYAVEGKEALEKLTAGDKIISAKVVKGLENLVEP